MEAVKITQAEKEITALKVLFDALCQQYHSLVGLIQKLPVNEEMKGKVALFMDTGFLWMKEAFLLQEMESKKAELAVVPDSDVALDTAIIDE